MTPDQPIKLTEIELRRVIRETVHETLVGLGIEPDDPNEMQKDFIHLRDMRLTVEQVKKRSIFTMIGLIVAGLVTALWLGIQQLLKGK